MITIEVGLIIALIGCILGLAAYFNNIHKHQREKGISEGGATASDASWMARAERTGNGPC
jgi:hypothetical protein